MSHPAAFRCFPAAATEPDSLTTSSGSDDVLPGHDPVSRSGVGGGIFLKAAGRRRGAEDP